MWPRALLHHRCRFGGYRLTAGEESWRGKNGRRSRLNFRAQALRGHPSMKKFIRFVGGPLDNAVKDVAVRQYLYIAPDLTMPRNLVQFESMVMHHKQTGQLPCGLFRYDLIEVKIREMKFLEYHTDWNENHRRGGDGTMCNWNVETNRTSRMARMIFCSPKIMRAISDANPHLVSRDRNRDRNVVRSLS